MAKATSNFTRRLPAKSLLALSLLAAFDPGIAATRTWSGAALSDNNWNSISNWGSTRAPLNGDTLIFAGNTRLSNSNNIANLSVSGLTFAAGAGAFFLNGNALALSNPLGSFIENKSDNIQTINLGISVAGTSVWQGGNKGLTFNGEVAIGDGASLTLAKNTTINNQTINRSVGISGVGSLSILSGSVVYNRYADIGLNAGSTGSVIVDGLGSAWHSPTELNIGTEGAGTLTISNGGAVTSGSGVLGFEPGSVGVVTVTGSGSRWSTGPLRVGYGGTGTVNIENGGVVRSQGASYIADFGGAKGSRGTVTVTGSNSQWDNGGDSIYVGNANSGRAILNVVDGGFAHAGTLYIRSAKGSSNTVNVTGSGSWLNANLIVGDSGSGVLNIAGGGRVTSSDATIGMATNPSFIDNGMVNISGIGSKWTIDNSLSLGSSSPGLLNIDQGGQLEWGGIAYLGNGSRGSVQVTGAGSQLSSINGTLAVGFNSGAEVLIQSGARVSDLHGYIGSAPGSSSLGTGVVTVTGADSLWSNGTLDIGTVGSSTLSILNSGTVKATTLMIGALGAITLDGGTLQIGSGNISKGGSFNWASGALAYTGDASLGAGLLDTTLRLSTGRALNVASTLTLGNGTNLQLVGGALGANSLSFAGGVLQYSAADTADYSRSFSQAANQKYNIDTNGQNITLASAMKSAGGSLTKQGSGTLSVTGDNTYSGGITVAGGTLQIGNGGITGSINGNVANAGVLAFNRADNTTFADAISGGGVLKQLGAGALILTGAHTHSGGTTVSRGTLQVGSGGTLGSISGNVLNNSVLAFNRSDVLGFGGVISGSGALKQLGAGTLILTGANTHSGGTQINAGRLQIASTAPLGSGALSFGGGSLYVGTNSFSLAKSVLLNAGGGSFEVDSGATLTLDQSVSGNGGLTKLGGGTLVLAASNTYSGGTTVSGGTLQIGNGGTSGSIAGNVLNNSVLAFYRPDDITFTGAISGSGSLTKLGAGILTLTGANTYSGGTTVSAGTLQIGNGGTSGSISGDVVSNGTLVFNRADDIVFAGSISGTGGLTKLGAGKLTLTGSNIYTNQTGWSGGYTTVNGGTLEIANGTAMKSTSNVSVGYREGENATVNVVGAGSQWTATNVIFIGGSGNGTLNIIDGGVVFSSTAYLGSGDRDNYDTGGTVHVSGAGSRWNVYEDVLWVGTLGKGLLYIENGGVVDVRDHSWLGGSESSETTVTVTVTGTGSQWNTGGDLIIGKYGNGRVNIKAGAVVTSGSAMMGNAEGAVGLVTVTGANSTWSIGRDAYFNNGVLTISDGGIVNVGILGGVGASNGRTATVTVTGSGSQWNNADVLSVGIWDGTATLNILDSGKVTAQTLTIGGKGTVNVNGGTLQIASVDLATGGAFNWTQGTLSYTGDVSLGAGVLLPATTLTTGKTLSVAQVLTVDGDSTLSLNGGQVSVGALNLDGQATVGSFSNLSVGSGGLDNTGVLQLAGGTLNGTGVLANNGLLTGFGVIAGSGGFINNALLTQAGGVMTLRNTGANSNTGNWDLAAGRQLKLDGATLSNAGVLTLNGGSVTGSGTLSNAVGGTVSGRGVVSSNFVNAGQLVVDSGITNVSKAFSNAGQIMLGANGATLSGGSIANTGVIQGLGQVNNNINNTGTVQATGGRLTLNGSVSNTGVVLADAGATVYVTAGLSSNAGQIQLAGGTFDNHGYAMSNEATGIVSGAGTLRSGLLTNKGQLQLSGGTSSIYADVTSAAGSKIILSGGGNTTFYGSVDVKTGGELKVSQGSFATFFGLVQQRTGANFTGTGTSLYEGGLSVGASPGLGVNAGDVTFGSTNIYLAEIGGPTACNLACGTDDAVKNSSFDKYIVNGHLSLSGTLKLTSWNGYVAQAGDSFDLLDWGSESGHFSSIDASGLQLAHGTALDLSQLTANGSVSVVAVPEPQTWALMLAGLAATLRLARRRTTEACPRPRLRP